MTNMSRLRSAKNLQYSGLDSKRCILRMLSPLPYCCNNATNAEGPHSVHHHPKWSRFLHKTAQWPSNAAYEYHLLFSLKLINGYIFRVLTLKTKLQINLFFQSNVKKTYFLRVRISEFICIHETWFRIATEEEDGQSR
jgi:hypothetical protein